MHEREREREREYCFCSCDLNKKKKKKDSAILTLRRLSEGSSLSSIVFTVSRNIHPSWAPVRPRSPPDAFDHLC